MICPRCLKNEATVYFSRNINGKKEEYKVCSDCAKELGFFSQSDLLFNINDFMSGFMSKGIGNSLPTQRICPSCKMTLQELSKTSKLGCSKCYEVFDDYIEPIMKRIHGNSHHTGKLPLAADERLKTERKISSLKEELAAAVKREDFEQAAILRDKINELKGEE